VPFPPTAERFERLEETLQIAQQMWSEDDGPYAGRHFQLAETICLPPPVRGSVPIMIGGSGERKTLRFVAQYADACNLFATDDPATVAHKLDVLRGHCDAIGREFDSIRRTLLVHEDPTVDPAAFLAKMQSYAALGIDLVTMMPPTDDPVAWTTAMVEKVVNPLKELG
ncbi:MAG TPA: LLM class flavin-dependent oxidoreductase, partial [Nocardioides sp.]|nr:LLM class flavin-dependent oxidoreductase [Nocardioides sp.]